MTKMTSRVLVISSILMGSCVFSSVTFGQGRIPPWGTINPFIPKVNSQPGTAYDPNDVLNIESGASGSNPTTVPMRVVFRVIIQSPPPNATIVAEKTRSMVLQPGQQFVFPPEHLDAFNVGDNPFAMFFGSASLHLEEIGPNPAAIPGDTKSATFTRNP